MPLERPVSLGPVENEAPRGGPSCGGRGARDERSAEHLDDSDEVEPERLAAQPCVQIVEGQTQGPRFGEAGGAEQSGERAPFVGRRIGQREPATGVEPAALEPFADRRP